MTIEEFIEQTHATAYGPDAGTWLWNMYLDTEDDVDLDTFIRAWNAMNEDSQRVIIGIAYNMTEVHHSLEVSKKQLEKVKEDLVFANQQLEANKSRKAINRRVTKMHNERMREIVRQERDDVMEKLREIEAEFLDDAVTGMYNCEDEDISKHSRAAVAIHSVMDRLLSMWGCVDDLTLDSKK